MPDHGAAFGRGVDLAADEEVARARKRERSALLRMRERCREQHCRGYHHRVCLAAKSVHAFLRHFLFVAVDALAAFVFRL